MNLNQQVWRIIQQEPEIRRGLSKGVINIRALAKHYIRAYSLDASLDAVISSIRRFDLSSSEEAEMSIMGKLKGASISTKNQITRITLKGEQEIPRTGCKIVVGSNRTKIFGPKEIIEKLYFEEKQVKDKSEDLAEISIRMKEDIGKTKGVLAKVTNEIYSNDINIEDIVVCQPEFLIYLKTENLAKAHQILLQLVQ